MAMFFFIFSYQQKTARSIIVWQMIGTMLFTVNFFLLGMFFQHLGLRNEDTRKIRALCLVGSAAWLIFNCVVFALGALLCEAFNIVSILVAFARFNRKPKETE